MVYEVFDFLISLASILFFAKVFGEIALKLGQNPVIGELLAGIFIGPSVLGIVRETPVLSNISELGVIILLFEVGLSTDIKEFLKASGWAMVVAFVGVIVPYFLGYFVFLCFGLTDMQAIFAGAVLTATSVGVTIRVFMDLKCLKTEEAKIVLGAAIIDDVIGLTMLAVILKLITGGIVSFGTVVCISGTAVLFLVLSVVAGVLIAPTIFKFISKMKQSYIAFIMGIVFCFIVSALSTKIELGHIVGAFVAGLVLSTIKQSEEIKKDIKSIYAVFVPIFFVLMGTKVDISTFNPFVVANKEILILTGALFVVAFVGKIVAGFAVLKKGINKLLIGVSMVPRGEVGLIFAEIGLKNNVFATRDYSSLVAVIMLTTFITPIILKYLISKQKKIIQ
ncbi:Na+/H+-exchanging protein [Endomicrobiia bacterium]|uniref:NapA type Na+/H+ antiporter n=1 Tax=Endomicrobium trichonymphae TaxID=1408204 RepID=B1H0H6_ENDTX|nr:cation:proton antiporter [Candidatus Endomicrobium trichonymphae]BAG14008.1 NapA type Na+/H+ antiporter [Candidatus Endomicrobium trichonymphae]GHT23631.1 Na+/H+-exchanging protein [Endomicrobiia bacterium]